MMNELLEVKNKIEILNLEDRKNCCTNFRDEIKYLKEEISLKNLIIKILAENTYNSDNNKSNNCPCNFHNPNSRCLDRLNSPLQTDVVNLKNPVKDFQISTLNRFNLLTVEKPSSEEKLVRLHNIHSKSSKQKTRVVPQISKKETPCCN